MTTTRTVPGSGFLVPVFVFSVLGSVLGSAAAQSPPPAAAARTFELAALQQAAVASDPRMQQLQLLMDQSDLRLRNIAAGRLPAIVVEGQAQYQSDVPTAPFTLPSGQPLFSPPKATYDSGIRIDQRLFDPTLNAHWSGRSVLSSRRVCERRCSAFASR